MRLAQDFHAATLAAFDDVVREISRHVGVEYRLHFLPRWIGTDNGETRRTSATWFLPREGHPTNHTFRVDESGAGHRRWTVYAGAHRGPIVGQELVVTAPPGVHLLRHVASMVGLLPYTAPPQWVDVSTMADAEPRYVQGWPPEARCDGVLDWSRDGRTACGSFCGHEPHGY